MNTKLISKELKSIYYQPYIMLVWFIKYIQLGLLSAARLYAIGVIGRLNGWKRYDRDTYLEMDITELPPGEVM